MNIAICSIFRDAEGHLDRYFDQCGRLKDILAARGDTLRFNLAEGDSLDHTFDKLHTRLDFSRDTLIKRDHGGPRYGSVDNVNRFLQFSYVYTGVWANLREDDDVVIYMEGDLWWKPEAICRLIDIVAKRNEVSTGEPLDRRSWNTRIDAVSPMVWFQSMEGRFYDSWAYRRNGVHFAQARDPHPDIKTGELLELDSSGSCIVISGEAARAGKFEPAELCCVGLCQSMRKAGYRLWLDPDVGVVHL